MGMESVAKKLADTVQSKGVRSIPSLPDDATYINKDEIDLLHLADAIQSELSGVSVFSVTLRMTREDVAPFVSKMRRAHLSARIDSLNLLEFAATVERIAASREGEGIAISIGRDAALVLAASFREAHEKGV